MNKTDDISELNDLAASQWGMFTSAQAQEIGIRRNQISRMIDTDRVERVSYGVYRFSASAEPKNIEVKAAWLSVYPKLEAAERLKAEQSDAVVAGTTAAYMLGAGDFHASPYTFILRKRKQTSREDIRFLFCDLDEEDVVRTDNLPVTSFERTTYDLLRLNEDPDLVDKFVQDASRKGLYKFDQERLSQLLAPLAARYGFARGDGESFALDLLMRNASAIQISRALGEPSHKMSSLFPPSVFENMKTAFDISEVFAPILQTQELMYSLDNALAASTAATKSALEAMNVNILEALSGVYRPIEELAEMSGRLADMYANALPQTLSITRANAESEHIALSEQSSEDDEDDTRH